MLGFRRSPSNDVSAVSRVPALVGIQQHADSKAVESADAPERPQSISHHDQWRPRRANAVTVQTLRVSSKGLARRIGLHRNVEVRDKLDRARAVYAK